MKTLYYLSLFFKIKFLIFISISLCSYLDVEELANNHYGVEIINEPVLKGQNNFPHSVYLSSRFGQEYQCVYRDQVEDNVERKKQEKLAFDIGISHLLYPMQTEPCLRKTIHWWTYEFCYGKHILQYHMQGDAIQKPVIKIGDYDSEFDWSNDTTLKAYLKSHQLRRYHTHFYKNGSTCEQTQTQRQAQVQFECEESTVDYIHSVDEPSLCSYVFTIRTMKICHHPYLRPPPTSKPISITCNPILAQSDFDIYVDFKKQEKRKIDDENRQLEILKELTKRRYMEQKDQQSASKFPIGNIVSESSRSVAQTDAEKDGINQETLYADSLRLDSRASHDQKNDVKQNLDEDQESQKIDEGSKSVSEDTDADKSAHNKDQDFHTQKEYSTVKQDYEKIIKETQAGNNVEHKARISANSAMKTLGRTVAKLMSLKNKDVKELKNIVNDENEGGNSADKDQSSPGSDDSRVQIKVRIQSVDPEQMNLKDDESKYKYIHKLSSSQREKISKSFQEENDKNGFKQSKSKVRIEIISSDSVDKNGGNVHVLSKEDSRTLHKVLSAILGDTSDIDDEAQRVKTQEAAYHYDWRGYISKLQSSDSKKMKT